MKTQRKGEWLEIQVLEQWTGLTVENLLKTIWHTPKPLLHSFRMNKSVRVNGESCSFAAAVEAGDRLQLHLFPEEEYGVIPEYRDISILFEDDHLLIVNKPAGLDVHPTEKGQTGTLCNAVAFHLEANGIAAKVRHIHRLDRPTSGAVIFAKHALAGAFMDKMLAERKISRTYVAFVEGRMNKREGTIREPIGRDRHHAVRRRVTQGGSSAVTHFKVMESFHNAARLQIKLETGRTHQIRVHMSWLGHPLLGDSLYGGREEYIARPALHAEKVMLIHPILLEQLEISAPWPEDLIRLKQDLTPK